MYCYLNAVITLDPSGTYELDDQDVPAATPWRHGLILSWEWHTGAEEDGDPEKGPVWLFAALKADGSCVYPPVALPVYGYASIDHRIKPNPFSSVGVVDWDGGVIGGSWEHADALDAACEAWGTDETSE
ncbi:hypothetical protein N4G69_06905 [Streptomyces mirabilis]|uniref:hypothetical protein n=1 Tax=Streptomyces mirabilis TaxID=68239 RepID=UPI0021C2188E|nr:hypothetical protein [Streptomyces mirabilis]MCT9105357.1 hypothetical protein [Streptomyces mirabilis]